MRKTLIILSIASLLACQEQRTKLPFFVEKTFTPIWHLPTSNDHVISDHQLWDQKSSEFQFSSLEGNATVVNFFFTRCPGICPKLTTNLNVVQDSLKELPVNLLSYSVTPASDSVEVLNDYADRFEVKYPQWKLLTGEKETIYNLAYNDYFAQEMVNPETDFIHSEMIWLLDENGRIRGVYNGTIALEVERLIEDAKTLIN